MKPKKTKGVVIRVSQEVYLHLLARRRPRNAKTRLKESWDSLLRRVTGIPDKYGRPQACIEGFIVPGSAKFFPELKQARGEAIVVSVRKGLERPPRPVAVREVL